MITIGGRMALDRPTYKTIRDRAAATIESRLPGADARTPATDLSVQTHVTAEVASGLYDFGLRIADQILPNTADLDHLATIALDWGIYQKAAAVASGQVSISRTGTETVTVPAGTVFQASGLDYATDSDVSALSATVLLPVTCTTAGLSGNLEDGVPLSLVSPVAGLAARGRASGINGGSDQESGASLLTRLLARMRSAPHGGAATDYVQWATACSGITRAWTYGNSPRPGMVTVLVVADGNDNGPMPSSQQITDVQAYMDQDDTAPVTAEVIVRGPIMIDHDLIIAIAPRNSETEAAVAKAVRAWYRAESEPGQIGARSRLMAAISAADGEVKHRLVWPDTDQFPAKWEMAQVRSIDFQDY